MFKRKIIAEFDKWLSSLKIKKKALLVKGARQVGKTTIISEYAKQHYKNVVYINFKTEVSVKSAFSGDLAVDEIVMMLSALKPKEKFIPYKTVLIFDEVQECSAARASIKSFVLDGRYDVIASGSLLGIKGYNKKSSGDVPVGFEWVLEMHSMDFEEFLWALGVQENVTEYIAKCFNKKEKVSDAFHELMLKYFNQYICVGGMPEAVEAFVNTHNMSEVYRVQRNILNDYVDDFGKHLDQNENSKTDEMALARINEVFDSIPSQLAKENKKFQYSMIKTKGRSSEYRSAIEWLKDYGFISICYNLNNLELPLDGNKNIDSFKIYVNDTGLFVSMLEKGTASSILNGSLEIYKGAIYENIVADAFSKNGKKLYYFSKNSGLEVDFVTRYNDGCTLVEVKATNGKTKSSKTILEDKVHYNVNSCIKLTNSNINVTGKYLTIPYYMAYLLNDWQDGGEVVETLSDPGEVMGDRFV